MLNLLDEEELKQNESRKKDLIDLIASSESLLFVGAGSSAIAGYKVWTKIIEDLERLANECGKGFITDQNKLNNPLQYVEEIKKHVLRETKSLDKYHNLLYKEFGPRSPQSTLFHDTLVRLPFKGILTTNYDSVLEAALARKNPESAHDNSLIIKNDSAQRVSEFLLSLDHNKYQKRVAHLHGKYDVPNSIILSLGDYEREYGSLREANSSWSLHRKLLWAILATRRVVFVGFSLDDPYFRFMLDLVSKDLWRWDDAIHYAIMGLSLKEDKSLQEKRRASYLKSQFGIETVFYPNSDGQHLGLEHMINDIIRGCQSQQSTWMDSINQNMERSLNNED